MNQEWIKLLAIAAMLLNHIATIFLECGSFWCELFTVTGYFTAITMCYFLVEGYTYTRSKRNYAVRLALFAMLSQIPYSMAFARHGWIEFNGFSMMTTMLLCFGVLWVSENVWEEKKKKALLYTLILVSAVCDWAILAPVFTWLFLQAGDDILKKKQAFINAGILFAIVNFVDTLYAFNLKVSLIRTIGGLAAITCSALVITGFYNGKRIKKGQDFYKWFFYLFYPLHLLILGLLRIM